MYAQRLFDDARISTLLVDTGYGSQASTPADFARTVGRPVRTIVRIESVAGGFRIMTLPAFAPALASFQGKPETPPSQSSSASTPEAGDQKTARQQAEAWYNDAYDDVSKSLVLLWKEEITVVNTLHISILQNGTWTSRDLLPNLGFAHAFNPQMLLTHFYVHLLDANGNDQWQYKSLLSLVWWEEANLRQARYCPFFLDETLQQSDVAVYDLPTLIGSSGASSYEGISSPVYFYPALRYEGPGGAVLASFVDLASQQHVVIRVTFPTDLGKPDVGNITYQRRREPIVGIAFRGGIASPSPFEGAQSVNTYVGPNYNPTISWQNGDSLFFTRYQGTGWSPSTITSAPMIRRRSRPW